MIEEYESSHVLLPFDLRYIHLIETTDMDAEERWWHSKFADKRVEGEWFKLDKDDLQVIKEFNNGPPVMGALTLEIPNATGFSSGVVGNRIKKNRKEHEGDIEVIPF